MKHLYIIGNGFDIFTGLKTRYVDFVHWLQFTYPFVYENMCEAYEMEGEWWHDFEIQLGKLDVKRYVKKYDNHNKTIAEINDEIVRQRSFEENYKLPHYLDRNSLCAKRLAGLLDILQYCFEKWIEGVMSVINNPKYTHIERKGSFFINFNYTDVLQCLYGIKDEQILFIHGRASKHERLVFGHNSFCVGGTSFDEEQTYSELSNYNKNPYQYISQHVQLPEILRHIDYVHVYGFSISEVDEDYLDWIEKNTHENCSWEFSWYSEEDKNRIDRFILNHWNLKERHSLMQLKEIPYEDAIKG